MSNRNIDIKIDNICRSQRRSHKNPDMIFLIDSRKITLPQKIRNLPNIKKQVIIKKSQGSDNLDFHIFISMYHYISIPYLSILFGFPMPFPLDPKSLLGPHNKFYYILVVLTCYYIISSTPKTS